MVALSEAGRRLQTRWSHRIQSLPILALTVHSACNCRCVMCDIWQANADKREISTADLDRHLDDIRALRVQRVMLTGGEPLMHSNLWTLCDRLRDAGIGITLVTTGLLIQQHAEAIARSIDEVVVSIDGPPDIHDAVRGLRNGFHRIARGLQALQAEPRAPRVIVRSVVQRANHARLPQTIETVHRLGVGQLSFLAADVSSSAFNRPNAWSAERRAEVALSVDQVHALEASIGDARDRCAVVLASGFVAGGLAALRRIHAYYAALAGLGSLPPVRCNAPWVSAVVEADGGVRPCFFLPAYPQPDGGGLLEALNSSDAVAFRASLDVSRNETCQRCVCSLRLSPLADVGTSDV
jgi:MoaA/NifB/PqqE/SkfB family radical SAM enzyme